MKASAVREAIYQLVKKTSAVKLLYILRLLELVDAYWKDEAAPETTGARIALSHFALDLGDESVCKVYKIAGAYRRREGRA